MTSKPIKGPRQLISPSLTLFFSQFTSRLVLLSLTETHLEASLKSNLLIDGGQRGQIGFSGSQKVVLRPTNNPTTQQWTLHPFGHQKTAIFFLKNFFIKR